MMEVNIKNAALSLLNNDFSVIPCHPDKRPAIPAWKSYQQTPMTAVEAERFFSNGTSIAVIGGKVSGNLECLDFDKPSLFKPFLETLAEVAPGLQDKLVIRQTPSGGYHLIYRSKENIKGNQKLATSNDGKETWIETRGEGGYFLTSPSPNYSVIKNSLLKTPILNPEEIDILHNIAKSFNEHVAESGYQRREQQVVIGGTRPGDDFNQKVDFKELLENNGWQSTGHTGPGGEHWTRPEKKHGTSATLKDGCLYVFSSNAGLPLGPHDAFSVYAHINHNGDFTEAARGLAEKGFGRKSKNYKYPCDTSDICDKLHPERKTGLRQSSDRVRHLDEADVTKLVKKATEKLKPTVSSSNSYPIESLGPLALATKTLSEKGQVPAEMAGQCILATAALLAQSKTNVLTLAGVKPVSLYMLTIADSGEGKSTADDAAQHSVVERQKEDTKSYSNEIKQLNVDGKKGQGILREPYRIMRDGTVEGIRRSFRQGLPSQGVFSSEAGIMLAGYGMTPDNRAKSAANFNSLWDNGEISVARGQDGRLQLYDRRLSLHWLIQPDVAFSAINDPMLSDIGFWPRFLLACPPPSKPLKAMKFTPEKHSEIRDFWAACSNFLDEPLCEDCSELPVIEATPEAEELACKFYNFMQVEAKSEEGSLIYVKPFAVRATEQAFRIAAILSIFAGYVEIDAEMMRNGISLAGYSVATWSGVFGDGEEQVTHRNALNLYKWLLKQPYQNADGRTILRLGPPMLRTKSKRDIALAILLQAELISQDNKSYSVIVEV